MRVRHALLLAVSLACSACGAAAPSQADFSVYHTKDAIFQEVQDIVSGQQEPQSMAITSETQSEGNYSSTLSVVTVEPGGLTGQDERKIRLLLDFGQHGRELITNEVALKLLRLLAHDDQLAAFCSSQGIPVAPLQASLKHAILKVIPMENVRGRERVEAGQPCLRKNGRGVDVNRNWAVHWGFKEKDYDPEEEFPGDRPFSEPEAEMVRALAASFAPHAWVNVHSGMEALFMPYDHRADIPPGEGPLAALAILQELNRTACGGRCAVGSGGKSVGYLAHGTATDYMFQELHIPMAFTWEIYGDEAAAYNECFRMFNPTTREGVDAVVDAWTGAFLRLVLLLPSHPAVAKDSPAMVAAAGRAIPLDKAAAAAQEALTAKPVELIDRGGDAVRREAAAAVLHSGQRGGGPSSTTLGWTAALVVLIAASALQRRRVVRRLQGRRRLDIPV